MTPYETAARKHAECCSIPFREVFEAHQFCGYAQTTPEVFAMFRRVHSSWGPERIYDPWLIDPEGDCWHVWLAAGAPSKLVVPFPLPWISYEHRGRLRILNANRLLLHISCVCGFSPHGLGSESTDSIHPASACGA